jgi:glycosyltransferase involved in cell wall biosynthesis
LALRRDGIPVIFSYHRSRRTDPLPNPEDPGLIQSPVDITLDVAAEIASADYGAKVKVFVVSYPLPEIMPLLSVFERYDWTILYDCRDDWEEFAKVGMARWYDKDVEQSLVRRVGATLCVSGPLCEKMRRFDPNANVRLSPNAVESDFLDSEYKREPELQPRTIGYFGHLSDAWFDWNGFRRVAEVCADLRFEIIGHSPPDGLDLPDNVYLLGPKPWDQLHVYAKRWSAAIIPFKIGKLSDGVDPIKIYEYLALGLPVVSFRMPQIESYPYTVTVLSVPEFCDALRKAVKICPDRARIREFLESNTWEVRVRELISFAEGVRQ